MPAGIVGPYSLVGVTARALAPEKRRLGVFMPPTDVIVPKLTVRMDGLGAGTGTAKVRAVAYDIDQNLIAVSEEVEIPSGLAPQWVDFSFIEDGNAGVEFSVDGGTFGLHVGDSHLYDGIAWADASSNTKLTDGARQTSLTAPSTLPDAVIDVVSTEGFTTAGKAYFPLTGQTVTYTGKTQTTLTGCTGGSGLQATSAIVVQGVWTVNAFAGAMVQIIAGTGAGGAAKTITSNTEVTLTTTAWAPTPDGSSRFVITPASPSSPARVFTAGAVADWVYDDLYVDGVEPTLSTGGGLGPAADGAGMRQFITYVRAWRPSSAVTDEQLASYGFATAQDALGGSGGASDESYRVTTGWHGTRIDTRRGWYAVVAKDGPLADLVGERVRVTCRDDPRAPGVIVYVVTDATVLDDEVSLARQAYLRLCDPSLDAERVLIEVMP